MTAANWTEEPVNSSFGVKMTGYLPRSATNSKPSALGVRLIFSVLLKSNIASLTGVRARVRTPASSVMTGTASFGASNSPTNRGIIESGTSMRGFQKWARCHSSLYFKPTRIRSGPIRRVENR